jgi:hypothetical protein
VLACTLLASSRNHASRADHQAGKVYDFAQERLFRRLVWRGDTVLFALVHLTHSQMDGGRKEEEKS